MNYFYNQKKRTRVSPSNVLKKGGALFAEKMACVVDEDKAVWSPSYSKAMLYTGACSCKRGEPFQPCVLGGWLHRAMVTFEHSIEG